MSAASITFRCYQCQKLLGASRSRVGSVVNCPKCGAELVVPEPEEETPAETTVGPSTTPGPTPAAGEAGFPAGLIQTEAPSHSEPPPASFFPEIQTGPISLRPEIPPGRSFQVTPPVASSESPFAFLQVNQEAEPPAQPFPFLNTGAPAEPAPPSRQPAVDRRKAKRPRPATQEPPTTIVSPAPQAASQPSSSELFSTGAASFPAPSMTDEAAAKTIEYGRPSPPQESAPPAVSPRVMAWPTPAPSSPPVVPAISTESEPLREVSSRPRLAERDELPRRNDVAIPRTAVVLWSFFVLLALIAAFIAGLFLGHFVWK